jgi:hypothetical protein
MRVDRPFDPIRPGEIDNFSFDFTPDIGTSFISSTSWVCTYTPKGTSTDSSPQARVMSTTFLTTIRRRLSDGSLEILTGNFSVSEFGNAPTSAVGGTYLVEATAVLGDGRVLKLSSIIPCVGA